MLLFGGEAQALNEALSLRLPAFAAFVGLG